MSDTKQIDNSPKFAFDLKDLTITAGSSVAMYWVIDSFLKQMFPSAYRDFFVVGLVGAGSITLLAPILSNLIDGKNLMDGVHFDKNMLIDVGLTGATTIGLEYVILTFFPQLNRTTVQRYVSLIISSIGSKMLLPYLKTLMN